jgi:hypothetical protein
LIAVKKASQVLADLRGFFFIAPVLLRIDGDATVLIGTDRHRLDAPD